MGVTPRKGAFMKNDYYKTVPIQQFAGIAAGHQKTVISTLYDDLYSVFTDLNYSQFMKIFDWKTSDDINDKHTKKLFLIACGGDIGKSQQARIYAAFIENFLAKFLFANDLFLNIDAIRLFQSDFLGWKDHEIV